MRNLNYYLFIFFGIAFSLFFVSYSSNQSKVLGTTTSDEAISVEQYTAIDKDFCINTRYGNRDQVATCQDKKGTFKNSCNGNLSTHYRCNTWQTPAGIESAYCSASTDSCAVGTQCINGDCPARDPFIVANSNGGTRFVTSWYTPDSVAKNIQSSQPLNTWCVRSNLGCEDATGRYFNFCQNGDYQIYDCTYDYHPLNDQDAVPIAPAYCQRQKSPNLKCSSSGSPPPSPTPYPTNAFINPKTTDGTWCIVSENNSVCQDNNGTYKNYCSGKVAQKYYCTFAPIQFDKGGKNMKCVVGAFPCTKSCNQGVCGDGTDLAPIYIPKPTPTSKFCSMENGPCQINNFGKWCCEGAVCLHVDSSGNGICGPLKTSSKPTTAAQNSISVLKPTTAVPTSTPIPTFIQTLVPSLKPTSEPVPTTFNPTPHRATVSFWNNIVNWFKLNQ